MRFRLIRHSALSALLLAAIWVSGAFELKALLRAQEAAGAGRLAMAMRPLLERAYHAKDDLALQNSVQALAQVQGVVWVSVTDRDGRILADSEATLLSRSIESIHRSHPSWLFALREDAVPWGTLWLGFVDQPLCRMITREERRRGFFLVLIWLGFLIYNAVTQTIREKLEKQAGDFVLLQEEQDRKLARAQKERREGARLSEQRLKLLIEQFQSPAVFLDERQRVVAVNQRMLDAFRSSDDALWLGRSWQEIPGLEACGAALEESFQSPGKTIEVKDPFPSGRLFLQTPQDPAGPIIGTWMTLEPPSNLLV